MLFGSFRMVTESPALYKDANPVTNVSLMSCVFVSRYTHAISIAMKLLAGATRNYDMKIVGGLTQALQTFLYLAALLFIQYNLNNTRMDDWKTRGTKEAAYWLTVEVLVLYFYIFAGVVYLVTVS